MCNIVLTTIHVTTRPKGFELSIKSCYQLKSTEGEESTKESIKNSCPNNIPLHTDSDLTEIELVEDLNPPKRTRNHRLNTS